MKLTSEAAFETAIEAVLLSDGYTRVHDRGIDRERRSSPTRRSPRKARRAGAATGCRSRITPNTRPGTPYIGLGTPYIKSVTSNTVMSWTPSPPLPDARNACNQLKWKTSF